MVRIIYAWQVAPQHVAAFRDAWQHATTMIHAAVAGARGSFLLQDLGDPGSILTIARWDSIEKWEAFWKGANASAMRKMRGLGERRSVTAYDEYADFTV